MKVLLATDGNSEAIDAAHKALALLHPDMKIDMVTVIPETENPTDRSGDFGGPFITVEIAGKEDPIVERQGRAALRSKLDAVGVPATSEMIEGSDPGPAVCRLAAERGVDLLVIGGSDKGWFQRLVQGSVMEYAAHHSPCPVLIVRHADNH
ncbi:MAG: universal stress protein [Actinomycetota bacterium]|nr:universal stress protein [Actinomycetota bacterium]